MAATLASLAEQLSAAALLSSLAKQKLLVSPARQQPVSDSF